MIKAAIVEDEQLAIDRLMEMLALIDANVVLDVVATNGAEAIIAINKNKPDLVFLDIHLPDMKGFEVITSLDYQPYIIFTTAYPEYAIEAFRTLAIDYLLKPYGEEQLKAAVNKYKSMTLSHSVDSRPEWRDIASLLQLSKKRTSLSVRSGDKIRLIDFEQIVYVQAEDKYTMIYLSNGKSKFCESSLKDIESNLSDSFLRIHRSLILNVKHVHELTKGFRGRYFFHFNQSMISSIRSGASYRNAISRRFSL